MENAFYFPPYLLNFDLVNNLHLVEEILELPELKCEYSGCEDWYPVGCSAM
jgi:hypothetical protein